MSEVRFRKSLNGGGGAVTATTTKNPLTLQFHRVDQYFSLNENLLPSEMQLRLCCFSLLSTQRPTAFLCPVYISLARGAANTIISQETEEASTLSERVCLLSLGAPDLVHGLSQRVHTLLSSKLINTTSPSLVSLY